MCFRWCRCCEFCVQQRRKLRPNISAESSFGKLWNYIWQVRCLCAINETSWCKASPVWSSETWLCLASCPSFVVKPSLSASFQKQRTDYIAKQPDPVPATPSPPPTPAPVPVAVPLPPTAPAPIPVPVPKAPATISRQSSTSSDSGGSVARDTQRQKQVPVDRKFVWEARKNVFLLFLCVLLIPYIFYV